MKPEIKAQWIAAMESGDYAHGKEFLRREGPGGDRYCCLGVLCDLHAKKTKRKWVRYGTDAFSYVDSSTGTLPLLVMRWAGLRTRDFGKLEEILMEINDAADTVDYSKQIAIIKENL